MAKSNKYLRLKGEYNLLCSPEGFFVIYLWLSSPFWPPHFELLFHMYYYILIGSWGKRYYIHGRPDSKTCQLINLMDGDWHWTPQLFCFVASQKKLKWSTCTCRGLGEFGALLFRETKCYKQPLFQSLISSVVLFECPHLHFQDNKLFYCQKGLGISRSHTNSYKLQAGFPGLVDQKPKRSQLFYCLL